ncbi:phospholipid-transporting ATPase ABCA1 isoform X1 [Pangasianodon hypophthalmus]|uniref:phospholipid-transporting ATPase ABCA1 isoform X1 n=1 Tax=Pangasianodon hypophthalmus TaxID=310915 RepID=UPI002307D4EC|nr:phospholipid-transporting ATPase ABCA1 isoform X1 [Pangasianodon hypophthalmus]XP_034157070.2 phospholipid-transporting ATPase ABCA1 isoform X1 [Pangasianodon hypophthalmus]
MGLLVQLRLLLWKNFTLRKRQKLRLVIELIWPLFLFFILVWVRSTNHPVYKGQCHYPNKPMPSAGVLPWLQGMVCNIQNPCVSEPTPGETPGQVNNFNDSIISKALVEVQSLLADSSLLTNIKRLSDDIIKWTSILENFNTAKGRSIPLHSVLRDNETFSEYLKSNLSVSSATSQRLMSVRLRLNQLPALSRETDLRSTLCNSSVDRFLEFNSTSQRQEFQNITCSMTPNQLRQTRAVLLQNLDNRKLMAAVPLALNLNPADFATLLASTSSHAAPLANQVSKLQTTVILNAMNSLDFHSNPFGSLTLFMCGGNSSSNTSSTKPVFRMPPQATLSLSSNSSQGNSSEFCQNLIDTLTGTPSLRLFWSSFRPLLQGRVLYTPDTPFTRQVMAQANSTFNALAKVGELADAWLENEDEIWNFFQNSTQINTLRALLQNPLFSAVLDQRLNGSRLSSALIANFLFNGDEKDRPAGMPAFDWRNIFNTTSQIATLVKQVIGCFNLDKFQAMASESMLVEQALKLLDQEKFWAGVVFTDLDVGSPSHIRYKIRMDVEDTERTDKIKDRSWYPSARDNPFNDLRYVRGGFVYLQDMLDRAIVQTHTGIRQTLGVYLQQMPYPCYVDDAFVSSIATTLPMFLVLAYMYTVCQTIKGLVLEKELRLKEVLRVVGVRNGALWFSWFTENMVLLMVPCALISIMLKYGKILRYSDPSVIFVFLLVFCIATVMQCFFISVFFSRANLAAACGGLIYFLLYLPHVLCYAWRDVMTFRTKLATSLLSCVAFGYGCENFARYEEQGIGIQWKNIMVSSQDDDPYTFIVSIFMMLIDALFYWILTWYIENIFPGQYGIPKPWYFPFTSSYWCGTPAGADIDPDPLDALEQQNGYLEKPAANLKAGVSIRNLVKVYKTGKKLAVDKLSLDFYQDQITSFLGHNGAGKTTTMSILTGLFPPTSGTAYVNGFDIRKDMDSIRKTLGMCPQHNVLFNDLTVEEHIYFYARLKGRSSKEVKQEIDQMIKDVGLPHKRKDLAKNLSGGMQRKLSVAIAFVGGSNVVILDEPTAGVDPYARRGIWELLLKYKTGRTIILSTHHMDEADILGDRIAIISHGKVCCCGSSLFLKKTYGSGYYLTLARANQEIMTSKRHTGGNQLSDASSLDEGIGSGSISTVEPADIADVTSVIRLHVPEANFLEVIGQELVYVLPYAGSKDGSFASLFKELDLETERLGISSYGISDTSLEEIFLKVAEETGVDVETNEKGETLQRDWKRSSKVSRSCSMSSAMEHRDSIASKQVEKKGRFTNRVEDGQRPACVNGKGSYVITGWPLIRHQFLALFIKRFHHARRSRKGIIAQVVLPALFVCLSLIFSLIVPPFVEYPSLELQPWMYGKPQNTFYSADRTDVDEAVRVTRALLSEPGFGTRCMDGNPIPKYPCTPSGATDWFTPSVDPSILEIFKNGNWSMQNPSPDCQCSTPQHSIMLPACPPGAGGLPPPQKTQNTTDTLQDLTGRNMTDFLLKTYAKSGKIRYGGISVGAINSQVTLNESEITALVSDLKTLFNSSQNNITEKFLQDLEILLVDLGTKDNVKVWFYNQGWHAIVSFLNVATNAILRGNLPAGVQPKLYGISAFNHPLNLTKEQLTTTLMSSSTDVVVAICVIFAMSFIPASFVLFLIQERVSKAKHLQFVSGVNPAAYWVANFTWDMCNYVIPCLIVIVIFLCFQQKAYVSPQNLPALILLLVLYGWAITPMMYPASFVFSVPSTAYVVLTCINLFIGINGSIATFVMELFNDPNITDINNIVKQVLLIFPHFCLGRGLIDMAKNQAMATLFISLGEDRFEDPLSWKMVGKNLCAMAIQGIVMFGFTLLIQYKFFCKPRLVTGLPRAAGEEDEDVARERERVQRGKAENDLLRICDLTKVYSGKKVPAVDRITVGVPAAECFGLLGINGAGKTTTFKMLTGDIRPSGGEAFLSGYSIRTEMRQVHQNMGYCPQFDAIDDLLTGREHLEFYARLRGVPEREVTTVAEWGIQKLGLVKYSNKSAGTYSGGNKRKLSTAMALIGCPPLIFLDEPTTGMDPKARRFLWDCILSVIKEGRSVILTSHSMEECEALCTRMAIMVNGQFKCLGSIQHLKSRFGDGYTVIVRVRGGPADLSAVEEFVTQAFPDSVLKEKHHNTLQYQMPHKEGALSHIFSQFSRNQHTLGVEDYSVSQTTLDQVFVNFAQQQHDAEDGVYENPVDLSDEIPMQSQTHTHTHTHTQSQ